MVPLRKLRTHMPICLLRVPFRIALRVPAPSITACGEWACAKFPLTNVVINRVCTREYLQLDEMLPVSTWFETRLNRAFAKDAAEVRQPVLSKHWGYGIYYCLYPLRDHDPRI